MKKAKLKKPSADDNGSLALIRKKDQAMTKGELVQMVTSLRAVLLKMTAVVESIKADAKETRNMVYQLHNWEKVQPRASNFNRVIEQEREKAEARRKEREERERQQ